MEQDKVHDTSATALVRAVQSLAQADAAPATAAMGKSGFGAPARPASRAHWAAAAQARPAPHPYS